MRSIWHKITGRLLKKIFFLICIACVFLLGFYLYYEKYDALLAFARSQTLLHHATFLNTSQARPPEPCVLQEHNAMDTGLILIISPSHHTLRRQIIRNNWAQKKVITNLRFGVIFVIEEKNDSQTLTQNGLESEMFGDIIRTNLVDSYSSDIQKTLTGFQWVLDHCPLAKFIIKTDDDVFINPFALRKFLQKAEGKPFIIDPSLMGKENSILDFFKEDTDRDHLQSLLEAKTQAEKFIYSRNYIDREPIHGRQDVRDLKFVVPPQQPTQNQMQTKMSPSVHDAENYGSDDVIDDVQYKSSIPLNWDKLLMCFVRQNITNIIDLSSKWEIEKTRFKDGVFPTYCAGVGYIAPTSAVKLLVQAHYKKLLNDILPMEDVYVTGILAREAGIDHAQISTRYAFKPINLETITNGDIIFVHLDKDAEGLTDFIWNRILENLKKAKF